MTECVYPRRFQDVPRGRDWCFKPGTSRFFARLGVKRCRQALARDLTSRLCEWEWRARDDEQVERSRLDHEQWVADMDAIRYAAWDWEYERMEEDALERGLVA